MEQRNDLRNEHYDEQYRKMQRTDDIYDPAGRRRMLQALLLIAGIISLAVAFAQLSKLKEASRQAAADLQNAIVGEEGHVTTISENTLKEILNETKLYTAEYPYNGYVAVPDGMDGVKYYAAYEGNVKAGFDASKIELELDEASGTITVRLPEVTIEPPVVNAGTIEYIFKDKRANTETVGHEAYKFALSDLNQKAYKDEELKAAAENSAKIITRELIEPWINNVDTQRKYTVTVLAHDEALPEENVQETTQP